MHAIRKSIGKLEYTTSTKKRLRTNLYITTIYNLPPFPTQKLKKQKTQLTFHRRSPQKKKAPTVPIPPHKKLVSSPTSQVSIQPNQKRGIFTYMTWGCFL